MKFTYIYILIIFSLLFESCSSFKNKLIHTGSIDEAIHNAILDFSNSNRLYEKNTVFSVLSQDTTYRMVLNKVNDGDYKWVKGKLYEEIITVSISPDYNKLLLTSKTKIGSKGKLPSRYILKNGKLFYWWDNNYPLTKEILDVFKKYNLLQGDEGGWKKFPDYAINDTQKGVDYYFCKNDLTRYKKVTTIKALGYYDIPNLKCSFY